MSEAIRSLARALEDGISVSLDAVARTALERMRLNVPVKSGKLRDSLRYEIEGHSIIIGSGLPYAGVLNSRQPFLEVDAEELAEAAVENL